MVVLQLVLNKNLYSKDPQSSELGQRITEHSIEMIHQLGFEGFTFKKLSDRIDCTEASVYRYFENKHRLLVYLITWYWAWLDYRIEYETHNLEDPKTKLSRALRIITEKKMKDPAFPDINEEALHKIVIAESHKIYLAKQVDEDNKDGFFRGYKSLCKKIAEFITEINPSYPYPSTIVSTAMMVANQQIFFAEHLPSLTELSKEDDPYMANYEFLKSMIFQTIEA
ncbi:TetR/AcrR family transcriptional regulator [Marinoscillum sp. 108]|uniref:TetR/AcrR family transcriptional regulator n=1 Tax=Marinoscillum luteum TaxID=861051 RepID=A0ABW7N9G8_9BACT|nr:TetR/AcrR family transcriptional regulator [Marinoscillum sp. 108]VXD17162.1 TetR family transcriptional regulator [Marinoscillum sp. 108]